MDDLCPSSSRSLGWVIAPWSPPAIPVFGEDRAFPVRRIWCVGRNYEEHAREMGGSPEREPPFFFAKPADAVVPGGGEIQFPSATSDLHHEVEFAVALSAHGIDVDVVRAREMIYGYAVALDMTRRDLQAEAKRTSRPWDIAKGFDRSCPIGEIRPRSVIGELASARLQLSVNGALRQSGDIADMVWSPAECVAALSRVVELCPGDIILTGTPAGVGPVVSGDRLDASCEHLGELSVIYS